MIDQTSALKAFAMTGLFVIALPALPTKPGHAAPSSNGTIAAMVLPVHRQYDYHCHRRRGYRRWCHQGARDRLDDRDYKRPGYEPRRTWRRRSWRRWQNKRREGRGAPDWQRPDRRGPSVYQTI